MAWIYSTNQNNTARFTLGETGTKIIGCIGVNPSTAEPEKLDRTIQSVKRIATTNGFDGWLMLNLYPQRATDPADLHKRANGALYERNQVEIREAVTKYNIDTLWFAYGDLVLCRSYLSRSLIDVKQNLDSMNISYVKTGQLTLKNNPRHPLYQKTASKFTRFML